MSAARFENGRMVQLDRKAEARQVLTADDVKDPERLARILNELRSNVDEERRRFKPSRIYFPGVPIAASTKYRFAHRFGGRVNWWVVSWKPTNVAANPYAEFFLDSTTDDNVLVLLSSAVTVGTLTLLVEEAG
jgi:hypothetical protein